MYRVNEIFYSLQGEGVRKGVPSVFLRFSGCNVQCSPARNGLQCDTDYHEGVEYTESSLAEACWRAGLDGACRHLILTGGEPLLQAIPRLLDCLVSRGFKLALETNGTIEVPVGYFEWICVSPKVPDKKIRQRWANEVKFVVNKDSELPKTTIRADHYVLSPAYEQDDKGRWCLPLENVERAMELCLRHPMWRFSDQSHKTWRVR